MTVGASRSEEKSFDAHHPSPLPYRKQTLLSLLATHVQEQWQRLHKPSVSKRKVNNFTTAAARLCRSEYLQRGKQHFVWC